MNRAEITDEQKQQARLYLAQDMIKKQFVHKTLEVLADYCLVCQPEKHTRSDACPAAQPLNYQMFQKWVVHFASEPFVGTFRMLAEVAAKNIMDPVNCEAPNLDYTAELPASMTPHMLINIYNKLWEIQTQTGVELRNLNPEMPLSSVHARLDVMFEKHRIEAFESVMETSLDVKADVHITMIKAYQTYATSTSLAGFENAGASFVQKFNKAVVENLELQEKTLANATGTD